MNQTTMNNQAKIHTKCSYCEETGHNITKCTKDEHLVELLEQHPMPDFFKMSVKTCKRVASLIGIQTSLPRIRLATRFTKIWKEKNVEPIIAEDCAICMEKLKKTNVCTTACGHMFCLECIFKVKEKSNNCPLCRKPLSKSPNIMIEQNPIYPSPPPLRPPSLHRLLQTQQPLQSPLQPIEPPMIPFVRSRSPSPFPDIHNVYMAGLLDNENIINQSNTNPLINESLINNIEYNNIIVNETITNDGIFIDSIVNNITTPTESITISVARNLERDFTYPIDIDNEY